MFKNSSKINKYYQVQNAKGINKGLATLLLPGKVISHIRNKSGSNVYYGFDLYDRPLLASYPRSGTNWTRYIIESLSGLPTPGQTRLVEGDNYYLDRAHCAYPVMNLYQKVMLVVRDYRECILRHHKEAWTSYTNVIDLLTDDDINQPASWYIKNLQAFDAFEGEKIILYYEDLLQSPQESVLKISRFLDFDQAKTQEFIQDLDIHFAKSVNSYTTKRTYTSETSSSKDFQFHAKTKLTPNQIVEFDEFYCSQYPEIVQKYLSRYLAK